MGGSASPVISVLLPARNAAACLGLAIQSLLRQTFAAFEVIVVENGSTDATPDVAHQYAVADRRVRVTHLPEPGIVGALNHGFSLARGPLIARMDADDVCAPQRFAHQMECLHHTGAGLVSCLVRHAGSGKAQAGYASYVEWTNTLRTHQEIALHRFVESPIVHPTVLFHRELAEWFGAWRDGAFPEDYELWLRWLEAGVRMEKVPEVLLEWRDPPHRLSRTDARYHARAFFECKAGYLQRWLAIAPKQNRALLFWGAGRETRRRLEALTRLGVRPDGWIDVNPRLRGQSVGGAPVCLPDTMPSPRECFVLSAVTNRGARARIVEYLEARGFRPGEDYILAG